MSTLPTFPSAGRTIWRPLAAHLFAWVPPAFEAVAQRGIDVNPEACIQWLDNWQAPGRSALVDAPRGAQ